MFLRRRNGWETASASREKIEKGIGKRVREFPFSTVAPFLLRTFTKAPRVLALSDKRLFYSRLIFVSLFPFLLFFNFFFFLVVKASPSDTGEGTVR